MAAHVQTWMRSELAGSWGRMAYLDPHTTHYQSRTLMLPTASMAVRIESPSTKTVFNREGHNLRGGNLFFSLLCSFLPPLMRFGSRRKKGIRAEMTHRGVIRAPFSGL
ncbi:hypothetical protein TNCT_364121 [Trichonephila clavata]|uniref:Uncharacterized protein n=1 Tax=Trichonephila clavata TaxID=2740835 RepID=A0A8X6J2J2_TRICU|nr:hypothetical protein TNCT_364121 [Trichonephila clavata]